MLKDDHINTEKSNLKFTSEKYDQSLKRKHLSIDARFVSFLPD